MKFKFEIPNAQMHQLTLQRVETIFSDDYFAARCFNLWEAHLEWLYQLGWARALERVAIPAEKFGGPTGHEVVDLLNDFIFQTGLVNAHFGLTSSDVVDNVRLMQINESLRLLRSRLSEVTAHLSRCLSVPRDTVAFTHWQPAAPISWEWRVAGWIEPLTYQQVVPPCIYAKKFGGPVGDRASLKLIASYIGADLASLPFDWHQFDLEHPNNAHPIQSSDHQCELVAIQWCCNVAAQIHKIAQDLRFLASHRIIKMTRPETQVGSSSMPHKTNPHKWEKVCAICRSISTTQSEMWAVAAHNSLERTLDTSWQIKNLIRRCLVGLAEALDIMATTPVMVDPRSDSLLQELRDELSSDRDLTRQVLAGKNRWQAYQDAIAKFRSPESAR